MGTKISKYSLCGGELELLTVQVKLACWLRPGLTPLENWFCNQRAANLPLAELAPSAYPFSFRLFIPTAAAAASNPSSKSTKQTCNLNLERDRSPEEFCCSGQCSEQALAQGWPDLVSYLCQSWKL